MDNYLYGIKKGVQKPLTEAKCQVLAFYLNSRTVAEMLITAVSWLVRNIETQRFIQRIDNIDIEDNLIWNILSVSDSIRKKYSDLTTSYVEIKKENADDGDYSTNYASIEAYKDGANIYVKTILNDAHVARSGSGSGYGGAWSWSGTDQVPGTSTVTVASLKLSNASGSVNITNPSFTVTDNL